MATVFYRFRGVAASFTNSSRFHKLHSQCQSATEHQTGQTRMSDRDLSFLPALSFPCEIAWFVDMSGRAKKY